MLKTEKQIVDDTNKLARLFYKMSGNAVPDGDKFYEAHHSAEVLCWDMAMAAYDHIEGTDVIDALCEIED